MIQDFFNKMRMIFQDKILRKRIFFTLGVLIIFRFLAAIPIPGIDHARLSQFFAGNEFLGMLNIFSGGGLSQFSIVMLGVVPYITGSIIMQLMTVLSPKLKQMYQEEGEAGRRKFAQYGRIIAVPLAIVQGFSFIKILESQGAIAHLTGSALASNLLIITAGSILIMWIGELISEYGIGNGISLIIFAGIVANIPTELGQLLYVFNPAQIPLYLVFIFVGLLVIMGVVIITEAERPIPITYARQVRGNKVYGGTSTYLPLRRKLVSHRQIQFIFPSLRQNGGKIRRGKVLKFVHKHVIWHPLFHRDIRPAHGRRQEFWHQNEAQKVAVFLPQFTFR